MNFNTLVSSIRQTQHYLQQAAAKAVNQNLSLRNWLIGMYIVEYEQNGDDRAEYGTRLLQKLARVVDAKGLTAPELSRCRQFYLTYPQIFVTLSQKFTHLLPENILATLSQKSQAQHTAQNTEYFQKLINNTPYSHFAELIKIDDPNKRSFYEMLILKTTPGVRTLRRLISTLTYERTALAGSKDLAFEQVQRLIVPETPFQMAKSHYFLEFLNINHPGLIEESEFEQALLDHLQDFMIELGYGFCFEARQKRILIGDEYFFVDLVFYHRILKCHVLIELKVDEFRHADASQLNTYLNYYKAELMQPDDNPPVGILLVTDTNNALVKYAIAGMDNSLFVSKYLVQLPSKEQLEAFIINELQKI
jgi:predicted nuclease of restriction endonuclease-like (RecB) superfamily